LGAFSVSCAFDPGAPLPTHSVSVCFLIRAAVSLPSYSIYSLLLVLHEPLSGCIALHSAHAGSQGPYTQRESCARLGGMCHSAIWRQAPLSSRAISIPQ